MNGLVSVCIPSYERPHLLVEAISSCFKNTYRPVEIIIGDDSRNDDSANAVAKIDAPDGISIRHRRNSARLGQHANVNSLFDAARGTKLTLLHDDDRFHPGGIDALCRGWAQASGVLAVFGKQRKTDAAGNFLAEETRLAAERHFRTSDRVGLQPSSLTSALTGQFWYGYLLRTSIARSVRYPETHGDNGDYDFGIRLAMAHPDLRFSFIDEYVVDYRATENSVSLTSMAASQSVEMLLGLEVPSCDKPALELALRRLSPRAVPQLARRRQRRAALSLFFSRHYTVPRTSMKGLYHLASITCPGLASARDAVRTWRRRQERRRTMHGPITANQQR